MKRFYDWLQKEAVGKKLVKYISYFILFSYVYGNFVIKMLPLHEQPHLGIPIASLQFLILLITTVAIEELLFRGPLIIPILLKWTKRNVLLYALPFSMVFGLMHGGWANVLVQGAEGLYLCILVLKCGGLQGGHIKGFCVAYTAHLLFDIAVFALALLSGQRTI